MPIIETIFGVSWPVFLGLTVALFGGCAFMAGQGAALGWRPPWTVAFQAAMLGGADRFLAYALFEAPLWSGRDYLTNTAVLMAIGITAHRLTLARRMCSQYPWLYLRTGPFTWRSR
ncbi:MAG: DUF6867 family protein [Rhodospirillaceae bacterium]